MSTRNTQSTYGSLAKWFHWLGALLIIAMLIYGTIFSTLVENEQLLLNLIFIHESFGLLILTLIICRWVWRRINPKPETLSLKPRLAKAAYRFHEISDTLHLTFAWILVLMFLLHVSAAIKHHYFKKDNTLRRMLPNKKY